MSAINHPPTGMTLTELGLDDPAALVRNASVESLYEQAIQREEGVVAQGGLEPPTPQFSVECSTN